MFKYIGEKKNVELIFYLAEENENYIIIFEVKGKPFIYDVDLKIGHKFLENIPKENINQKVMEYQDKEKRK